MNKLFCIPCIISSPVSSNLTIQCQILQISQMKVKKYWCFDICVRRESDESEILPDPLTFALDRNLVAIYWEGKINHDSSCPCAKGSPLFIRHLWKLANPQPCTMASGFQRFHQLLHVIYGDLVANVVHFVGRICHTWVIFSAGCNLNTCCYASKSFYKLLYLYHILFF